MTKTSNYQLSQWAASDPVKCTDFNADNAKIDAALAALEGRAKIAMGTYTGAGKSGSKYPNTLDFTETLGRPPKLVFVVESASEYYSLLAVTGQSRAVVKADQAGNAQYVQTLTWNGNGLSWHCGTDSSARTQLNDASRTYIYIAIG